MQYVYFAVLLLNIWLVVCWYTAHITLGKVAIINEKFCTENISKYTLLKLVSFRATVKA